MDTLPKHFTITNSMAAADGGSFFLEGHNETGAKLSVGTWWSIEQQMTGTTKFMANDTAILQGSEAKTLRLQILRAASKLAAGSRSSD